MKITKKQLREIIKEELQSVNESVDPSVGGELNQLNYKINAYYKQIGEVEWAMHKAGYSEKEIDNVHNEFEKIRNLHDKTIKRISRKLDK